MKIQNDNTVTVAIKICHLEKYPIDKKQDGIKRLRKQVEQSLKFKNPYVVKTYFAEVSVQKNENYAIIVMQRAQANLKDYMNLLSYSEKKSIIKNLIEGLKYLHSNGYVHRDIKMENILIMKAQNNSYEIISSTSGGSSNSINLFQLNVPNSQTNAASNSLISSGNNSNSPQANTNSPLFVNSALSQNGITSLSGNSPG